MSQEMTHASNNTRATLNTILPKKSSIQNLFFNEYIWAQPLNPIPPAESTVCPKKLF
jgi:hypothetical protein